MMKNKYICTIVCDDAQYNCCGQGFHIGDYICFNVTPFSKSGYKNFKLLSKNKIDYSYEDCAGGIGCVTGKVTRITLLIKNDDGLYEEVKEYDSGKTLSKESKFEYMLIKLEDSSYKKNNDKTFIYNDKKILITGTIEELGIEIAKEFKKLDFDIKVLDVNKENVILADKELRKIKSFSKAECNSVDLENKEQLESLTKYSEYKNLVIISNEKIYNNIIDRYAEGYKDCDIYHINFDKQIVEQHKIISKWKYYTFDELISMSTEEKENLFEVENKIFSIGNQTKEEIAKHLILKVINKDLF